MSSSHPLLRPVLWPLFVLGTTLGFVACFERGFFEAGLALVPTAAILLLFALEFALPERRAAGSARDPQLWNDAVHGVVGQGGGNALGQMVFVFGAALLAGEISEHWGANLWPASAPLWLQVPLLVFLADGLDYGRHRWMHEAAWFWPVHALHHNGDRLNVLKSGRGHFLDMFFRNLLCYAPLALIGTPREVMLAYAAAVTVFGPIAHANVSLRVPRFLHRWVLTPQVHRIHHAKPLALSCRNYANVFPIWDVIFGTFEHPDGHEDLEYGIEGNTIPPDIIGQTLAPFREWSSLWRSRRASRAPEAPATPVVQGS
jgi:sterol desaturase/sphingolipid hydroxylase (fatty acid hydroxylase superfamily)